MAKHLFPLLLALCLMAGACALAQDTAPIYLIGEAHSVPQILKRELELWGALYREQGARHLFIEYPYYTGELLNLWLAAEDDAILSAVFADWQGTAADSEATRSFFEEIKAQYPQTVFHGTDVGHQYQTTGMRFLSDLQAQGLEDSDAYALALEAIEQGKQYYETGDSVYRENTMTQNFIRTLDALGEETVMGIYGSAHTQTGASGTMAAQLLAVYGSRLHTEDLSALTREIEPSASETVMVNGKAYTALYFGQQSLSEFLPQYKMREFWRLEDAYEDFKDCPLTGDVLPEGNYPMRIAEGQVFMIDYTLADGTTLRTFLRCDGTQWQGQLITLEIQIE